MQRDGPIHDLLESEPPNVTSNKGSSHRHLGLAGPAGLAESSAVAPSGPSSGSDGERREECLADRAGDPDRIVELAYRAHAKAVWLRASSICGPDRAADVVQEVFLRFWRAPQRFDPARASLRTYLLVMARGTAIDVVRSDHRRRLRDEQAEMTRLAPGAADHDVLEPMLTAEATRRVTQALAHLAGPRRSAIETIYFDELTFAVSAARSGIPEGTLKSRVRSGLHQMKPLLADLEDRDRTEPCPSSCSGHAPAIGPTSSRHDVALTRSPKQTTVPIPDRASSSRQRRRERLSAAVAGLAIAALVASGCSDGADGASAAGPDASGGRLTIVTTVAPITSIVTNIVGDLAVVVGIVPEGTNSHTFEPRPSVAEDLSRADVVYMNGLVLEEPTKRLAEENLAGDAEIVELGSLAITPDEYLYDFSFPESGGKPNPHLWTDPTLALRYAEIVKDDMSRRDPSNAPAYAANFETFSAIVDDFDAAMRTAFATVPMRELLTYHDAYAYFARTYDWEVIGAIQISDFEDPTPGEVADLIDQVRESGIPAIFGSEVFPSPVLVQIGREAGVEYVDVLRDDDLPGAPGDPEHSWLGLMRFDFVTMTEALGGDATALRDFDVRAAAPDTARYPQ